MSERPVYCPCEDCAYNEARKHSDLKAREILAKLTGMNANDSTDRLTRALLFGKGRS